MSGYASTADLASIRAEFDAGLPDICTVFSTAVTPTDNGTTRTRTARAGESGVSCRFASLQGRELLRAQQIAAEADMTVTLSANSMVESSDEIEVTHQETGRVLQLRCRQ